MESYDNENFFCTLSVRFHGLPAWLLIALPRVYWVLPPSISCNTSENIFSLWSYDSILFQKMEHPSFEPKKGSFNLWKKGRYIWSWNNFWQFVFSLVLKNYKIVLDVKRTIMLNACAGLFDYYQTVAFWKILFSFQFGFSHRFSLSFSFLYLVFSIYPFLRDEYPAQKFSQSASSFSDDVGKAFYVLSFNVKRYSHKQMYRKVNQIVVSSSTLEDTHQARSRRTFCNGKSSTW